MLSEHTAAVLPIATAAWEPSANPADHHEGHLPDLLAWQATLLESVTEPPRSS